MQDVDTGKDKVKNAREWKKSRDKILAGRKEHRAGEAGAVMGWMGDH